IPILKEIFPACKIGLSDHTMGIGAAVASVALGVRVIEKHFTLDRSEGGVDSAFSMEPAEMKNLVKESERAFLSLGQVQLNMQVIEKKSKQFKRSIYAVEDISSGDLFTKKNIRVIRPGDGLEPKYFDEILGQKAHMDIKKGTPLSKVIL
ncbi:MAG: N-acetylneuraminate synthase family protein, partial [Cyclobacteriaceae bacterium]